MNFDPKVFQKGKRTLAKDPALKALFGRHKKYEFVPGERRSPFESLVRAIAHQQLHGKAAETILGRMLALFPGKEFPSPDDLLGLPETQLRQCGFSQSKTRSIRDIAAHTQLGVVPTSKEIVHLSNEEIISRLTKIFGVGRWTVEMLLIFQLGRLDVWPVDDFGVRKGYQVWQRKRKMPTAKDLKKIEKKFSPYQTIVSLYLWREADLAKIKK
jgi:DNA-3-methyladenine glycosylase II